MAEAPKAPRRWKLKPKQWEAIVNSTARINAATEQLQRERDRAKTESDLIMESHGLDPEMQVQLDPQTQELVEVLAPAAPAEPAPKKPARKAEKKPAVAPAAEKTPPTVQ